MVKGQVSTRKIPEKDIPLNNYWVFLAREGSRTKFDLPDSRGSGKQRSDSHQTARGYPSTTYETRKSAFMQTHESASKSGNPKPVALGRIDWAAKYLNYGQS
jgi:hypothetical protein